MPAGWARAPPSRSFCRPWKALRPITPFPKSRSLTLALGNETVMVVDDEEALRTIAQQLLSRRGYQTLPASCGEEALSIYREMGDRIDLVLLDMSMPGMGGHKCLQQILEINPGARVGHLQRLCQGRVDPGELEPGCGRVRGQALQPGGAAQDDQARPGQRRFRPGATARARGREDGSDPYPGSHAGHAFLNDSDDLP